MVIFVKKIKLIACDLDGTLLNSKKEITKENIETIKSLKEALFVVATGRPLDGIKEINELLGLNRSNCYSICYNGAMIVENNSHKIIAKETIPYSYIKEVYDYAILNNLNFHAFEDDGTLITNAKNPYTAVEEKINHIEAKVVDINKINPTQEFIKCMIVSSEENLDRIFNNIPSSLKEKMNVSRSSKIFLEFQNPKTNKGLGLEELTNYLNININDTMAIGDQDNDKSMLIVAGTAVLMENRFKALDPYADFITKSNEESGVAYAIKHFGFVSYAYLSQFYSCSEY